MKIFKFQSGNSYLAVPDKKVAKYLGECAHVYLSCRQFCDGISFIPQSKDATDSYVEVCVQVANSLLGTLEHSIIL
jgi:hypothetical protein